MRYVGRHRAPRPLLLRRPVVGGIAGIALLCVPLALTARLNRTEHLAPSSNNNSASRQVPATPLGAATGLETGGATIVPTDGSVVTTDSAKVAPTGPAAIPTPPSGSGGVLLHPPNPTSTGVGVIVRPTKHPKPPKPPKSTSPKPPVKSPSPPPKTTPPTTPPSPTAPPTPPVTTPPPPPPPVQDPPGGGGDGTASATTVSATPAVN